MKRIALSVAAVLVFACATAWAQQTTEMKLASFVGDHHAMAQRLIKWADHLEKQSGALRSSAFPARRWARCRSTTTSRGPGRRTSSGSCTARPRALHAD
jgi:hypothetical protein